MPLFSIIIATRDRPKLFAEALTSVLSQDFGDIEVIVINDGSSEEYGPAYEVALSNARRDFDREVRLFKLVHRARGHGQSYSFNFGVGHAKGRYVGFLDDDDVWTDSQHLARAAQAVAELKTDINPIDLYLTNQAAFFLGKRNPESIWLDDLENELGARGNLATSKGFYNVSVDDLMATSGFCHLNTMIIRRDLYEAVGGMDEGIRWECDRDIFLRLIDAAQTMLFSPFVVSRHNIPDPAKSNNMTTSVPMLEKRLYQLRVLDKASLFASHFAIRDHGHRHKAYALKKISEELSADGRHREAARYAREALGVAPTLKWAFYVVWLTAKSMAS